MGNFRVGCMGVIWGGLGCFNEPRKDKLYAYLSKRMGNLNVM